MLFHKLQEEYLFLANNNIRTIEDLLEIRESKQNRIEEIAKIQDTIYKQNSSKKRACKTDGDWRVYQTWHIDEYSKLDKLKFEKKDAKDMVTMAEHCLAEKLDTAIDLITENEEIDSSNKVKIPEFVEEKVVEADVVVIDSYLESNQGFEKQKPMEEPMLFYEEQLQWNEELQEYQETPKYKDQSKLQDVKVKRYQMTGKEDVYSMVEVYFKRIGHPIYFGEVYDEAKELEIAYKSSLIDEQSEFITVEMLVDGNTPESYSLLSVASKAKYFEFDMTDNNYNLNLYKAVMRKMHQKMSSSELFEGYQEIYEAKMMNQASGMQEKKWDRGR